MEKNLVNPLLSCDLYLFPLPKDPDARRKELDSLALVELEVHYANADFDLTYIHQPHTEFVPYDETYYDVSSLEELVCFSTPNVECFRVAFYLHHYDANQPLETPWGPLCCTALQALPAHLRNKQYIYWA